MAIYATVESGNVKEIFTRHEAFELNGVKHARNIWSLWSESDLKALGCFTVIETDTNYKDPAFYTNTNPIYTYNASAKTVTRTYGTATALDLTTIKNREKSLIKNDAFHLLQQSDWEVVKAKELGESVSSDTTTYRASVRTKANEMETAINNASDMAAMLTLFTRDGSGNRPIGDLPTR
tara:strand:+ start:535 stop:1071 length:537 start_codon:yes stop_codon:yes gene_type:complete